jgi:glyoxylase-like metal-dependent hydrolase (beta-lactamase superfamily II)
VTAVGLDPAAADLVIATHGHPDHSGGQRSWADAVPGVRDAPPMGRDDGLAYIRKSLDFVDEAEALARDLVRRKAPGPVLTRDLCVVIARLTGTDPPVTPQVVPTARAHLYALAREGLLEAAWLPAAPNSRPA